jgi:hypothetical protein
MSVPEKDVQRAASTSRRNFLLAPIIFGAGAILSQVLPFQEATAQTAGRPKKKDAAIRNCGRKGWFCNRRLPQNVFSLNKSKGLESQEKVG